MTNPHPPAKLVLAIALLLVPMLYIGSYLALVEQRTYIFRSALHSTRIGRGFHYRLHCNELDTVFWPLEQIDRRL